MPRLVRRHRDRFGRPTIPELALANAFYCSGHRWPARGWVLITRASYNQITRAGGGGGAGQYGTNFQLNLDDFTNNQTQTPKGILLQGLSLVQARCVSRGIASDPDAVYLVELTDARGLQFNEWFQAPTTSQYNIRSPAYPGQYYQSSLRLGTTAWTWDGMVQDLWGQMPQLGTYPTLPISPAGTPEGFSFPGVPAWEALCGVLDLLGLVVTVDLTKSPPYGIAVAGAADGVFTGNVQKFLGSLEDSLEWIDVGAGRVPGQVVVYFHRYNAMYATEETVRRDTLQWSSTPLYQVIVPAPPPFAAAPGQHFIWDDFSVSFDVNNSPVPADAATATAIAVERAAQYYNRVYRGTSGYLTNVYAGALPFATGSLCDGVCWYQRDGRAAWRTEVVRGPDDPWPGVRRSEE